MTDYLLELGKSRGARKVLGALRLPLPLPEPLRRDEGPYAALPLLDRRVAALSTRGGALTGEMVAAIGAAGALLYVDERTQSAAVGPWEEAGRSARALSSLGERETLDAVALDASGVGTIADLRELYDALAPRASRLAKGGRVIVLARLPDGDDAEADATRAAIEGFVRSLAKEIGKRGATANLVRVADGAEARLAPVLRYLLSRRSAFVTAQPITVDARAAEIAEAPLAQVLAGKIALVTGAGRGIGEATARAFAREGAHVLCADRPEDDTQVSQVARSIGGTPVLVDVASADAPRILVEAVRAAGGLDVVVHNAGITRDKTLARMKPEAWDQVLAVNLAAVVRLTRGLEPHLRAGGRVLGLSSVAGLAGNMGQTAYAASKAGVAGFVRASAGDLGSRGITANAIAPGFIETRMTAAIPLAIREGARRLSALGQGGLPEDVAEALLFLASPGAQGITGQVIRVCGGALIGA